MLKLEIRICAIVLFIALPIIEIINIFYNALRSFIKSFASSAQSFIKSIKHKYKSLIEIIKTGCIE